MNVMSIVRGAKFAALVLGALAIAGCAKQQPDQAAMANAATPGSQQDFIVNVGDRVFFETDFRNSHRKRGRRSTNRRCGSINTLAMPSPSRVMPTSAARVNTTSPSALAGRRR